MSSHVAPAPPLSTGDALCDRAVDYLRSSTDAPREYIREMLLAEVARLGGGAAITRYVYVLAASNIRTRLRHAYHEIGSS